jgi:hypothetical protein
VAADVGNLAFILIAKTGQFAAGMRKAQRPLMDLQRSAKTVQRGVRLAFSAIALRGFISALTGAVTKSRQLGVSLDAASTVNLDGLYRSMQALQFTVARLTTRIVAGLAPAISAFIDRITAAALWIDGKLSPGILNLAKQTVFLGTSLLAAAAAIKIVVVVQKLWNSAAKIGVVLQATLAALTGNWVALAAGVAVAGGTMIGLNAAFKEFGEDSKKNVGGVRSEVDALKRSMLGLGDIKVGRMGLDFQPMSTLRNNPQMQGMLQGTSGQGMAADMRTVANATRSQSRRDFDHEWKTTTFGGRFHESRGFR